MPDPEPLADGQKLLDVEGDSVRDADALMVCVTVDVEVKHSVAVGLIVDEIDGLLEDDIESLTDAVTEADKQSDAVADTEDVVDVHLLTVGEGEPERVADADID